MKDDVQHWHVHDRTFRFVMVLNGGAATRARRAGSATAPACRPE